MSRKTVYLFTFLLFGLGCSPEEPDQNENPLFDAGRVESDMASAVDTNPDAFQMDSEPDHSDDMKTTQDLAKSDSGGVEDAEGDQKVDEYEEITVDASILKSCSDVCAEEGKACDAMYNHFIFGPIASVHNYTEDVILSTNECDDIPDKTTSAFGGGEKELINYVCYCK